MYPQRATWAGKHSRNRDRQTWGELSGWYEICPGEPYPPQQAALLLGSFLFSLPPRRLPRGLAAHQTLPPPHPPTPCPRSHAASGNLRAHSPEPQRRHPPGWELGETPESQDLIGL